jgi:hypothetical protein
MGLHEAWFGENSKRQSFPLGPTALPEIERVREEGLRRGEERRGDWDHRFHVPGLLFCFYHLIMIMISG